MARIHPNFPLHRPASLGEYRERDVLDLLAKGLPDSFDVFHNLNWSAISGNGQSQHYGEIDLVVVSPLGNLVLLEVKAGSINQDADALRKTYGFEHIDIGQQVRRLHSAILERTKDAQLPHVHINTLLVLPDHTLTQDIVAYPRERIVDAPGMGELCSRIMAVVDSTAKAMLTKGGADPRQAIMDFLSNRFDVQLDVGATIDHLQRTTTQLASGLATWVPNIEHEGGVFHIEATAGSGKTQLALKLLRDVSALQGKALYLCYNRPLADHMRSLSPTRGVECTTFHQLCRDVAERQGMAIDFSQPDVFDTMAQHFVQVSDQLSQRFDLVIIDESQDFESDWIVACTSLVQDGGRLYIMGDPLQQVYEREAFDIASAVKIKCLDNFRSPRKVVDAINRLQLTPQPLQARSLFVGETPNFSLYAPGKVTPERALEDSLKQLWQAGYTPSQVAVLCWGGSSQVQALAQRKLAGHTVRHFTGQYQEGGEPIWQDGELLVESLRRFKGQSAPVVVLYGVDFNELTDEHRRKLFVGLTRGQLRVDVVVSEAATATLIG